jgi:hypothetical protein
VAVQYVKNPDSPKLVISPHHARPPRCHPCTVIDLGNLAGLLEHEHTLAAYCPRCDRWRVLPLAELVATGHGARRLPITVRCRACGDVGRLQVRPPVPTRDAGGWMEPH